MNKKLSYFALFPLILYLFYFIISSKLQLNIIAPTSSTINITNENKEDIQLTETSFTTNNKLIITNLDKKNTKSKGNEIFFTSVKTDHGGKISRKSSYKVVNGDWKTRGDLENDGKWFSTTPKSTIIFEDYTSNLDISFIKHPYSGMMNINWNGKDMGNIDLYSENETWQTIKLETPKMVLYSLISPKTKELHINTNSNIENIQITFGNQIIFQKDNVNSEVLNLNKYLYIKIIFTIIKNLIIFIFKILLLNFLYFLIGLPFIYHINKLSFLQKIILSIITGLALILIINTTLCFFFPVKISMFIFSLLVICIYVWNIIKNNFLKSINKKIKKINIDKNIKFLSILALVSTAIVFFPAIIEPGWFFGHSYTDSFEYTNLSQIFINTSPKNYGFSIENFRFAETIFLSVNSLLLQTTTLDIYSISAAIFWFQLPFLGYLIFKKIILNNTTIFFLGLIIFSFSANLYSLFSQSYLAQYFFVFTLIYGVLITLILLDSNIEKNKNVFPLLIVNAIIFTLSLILYPYHFYLPISLFITSIFYFILKKEFVFFKRILILGIVTLSILNINSLQIINFSKTSTLNNNLNNIGRYIVFPFYKNGINFGSKILGLSDFIDNSPHISKINNEIVGSKNSLNYIFNNNLVKVKKVIFLISIIFIIFGILYPILKKKKTYIFLSITSFIYIIILIYLFKSDQVYPFGKLGLTIGIILLINIMLGVNFINYILKKNKFYKSILNIYFYIFIFLNILSIYADNSLLYLNRNSFLLYEYRTHISIINNDLKEFNSFINSKKIKSNSSFLIIGNNDDIYKTDKDRVLNNRILQILSKYNVKYSNNLNTHIFYGNDFGYSESLTNIDINTINYIIVFNGYKIDEKINSEIIFKNNIFSIYKTIIQLK